MPSPAESALAGEGYLVWRVQGARQTPIWLCGRFVNRPYYMVTSKSYMQTMREIRPLNGRPAGFDFVRPCHPERSGAQAREVELRSSAERSDGRISGGLRSR